VVLERNGKLAESPYGFFGLPVAFGFLIGYEYVNLIPFRQKGFDWYPFAVDADIFAYHFVDAPKRRLPKILSQEAVQSLFFFVFSYF
jgi:hypothetical protein